MSSFFNFNIIDVLQVGIGSFTLFIAWKVYKKLLPSELKKRQLEAVLDLIEHLNKYSFNIASYYHTGVEFNLEHGLSNRNFFNYYNAFKDGGNFESFSELHILSLGNYSHPFNLSTFIENPLLPKKIANHLAPFINPVLHPCRDDKFDAQDRILILENSIGSLPREIHVSQLFETTAFALLNHGDFIKAIYKLKAAIEKWCKVNSLSELNFRVANSNKIF